MKNRLIEAEARRRGCKAVHLIVLWRLRRELQAGQERWQKSLFDMMTDVYAPSEIGPCPFLDQLDLPKAVLLGRGRPHE